MAINVNAANNQAAQLNDNISKLRDAKKQMQAYRSSVSNNWQGKEVTYILTAIDRVIGDIDSTIRNLESLSSDIKSTAAQIKREEDAAVARAAAERAAAERAAAQRAANARAEAARANQARQQQINSAQNSYDQARRELDSLNSQKKQLEKSIKKANIFTIWKLQNQMEELNRKIRNAESKVQSTYNALRAAKG